MKRLRLFAEKVSEAAGVPPELAVGAPKVTMQGNNDILIENHKGIIEYTGEKVRIRVQNGVIAVEGSRLVLDEMKSDSVSISGNIHNIMKLDGGTR